MGNISGTILRCNKIVRNTHAVTHIHSDCLGYVTRIELPSPFFCRCKTIICRSLVIRILTGTVCDQEFASRLHFGRRRVVEVVVGGGGADGSVSLLFCVFWRYNNEMQLN